MRLVIGTVMLFLLPGFAWGFWRTAAAIFVRSGVAIPLGVGFVAGLVLDQKLLRRWPGFETWEHELTHALASLLFLRKIRKFVVIRHEGGWVQHSGGFGGILGDDFIGFAPYIVPTFTLVSVLVRPVVPPGWFPWFDGWLGLTLGYHTWSTIRETNRAWRNPTFRLAGTQEWTESDLARRGLVYSFICVASGALAAHGFVFALMSGGYGSLLPWLSGVWRTSTAVWVSFGAAVHNTVIGLR